MVPKQHKYFMNLENAPQIILFLFQMNTEKKSVIIDA